MTTNQTSAYDPQKIEKRMDELARKYVETHDPEIIKEVYQLSRQLERIKKG